jgi:diguanylate cyclase (GGDEF)-like protein
MQECSSKKTDPRRDFRDKLRREIDALDSLPVQPDIAFRIIELGKDPEAALEAYVQYAELDASLVTRLLALTNSSWFGLSNKVRTVQQAISLLGVKNVRALAVGYCVAGLHNAWEIDAQDAHAYWEASLCKGVAAKVIARALTPDRSEEAFTSALLQDIGIGLLVSLDDGTLARQLLDPDISASEQIRNERHRLGVDHAQCAHAIAEKLRLPSPYFEAVAWHHAYEGMAAALTDPQFALALYVASLLPHDIRCWKPADIAALSLTFERHDIPYQGDIEAFTNDVQKELDAFMSMLTEGSREAPPLGTLIKEACGESVHLLERIANELHSLRTQEDELRSTIRRLAEDHGEAELVSKTDPLTKLLNRRGFEDLAAFIVNEAKGSANALAIVLFDLDRFKEVNDKHGHDCGDAVLMTIANRINAAVRPNDVVCRWGGDEIVMLMYGVSEKDCVPAVDRIQDAVRREPLIWKGGPVGMSMTAGICWMPAVADAFSLEQALREADKALYEAKTTERGSLACRSYAPASDGKGGKAPGC